MAGDLVIVGGGVTTEAVGGVPAVSTFDEINANVKNFDIPHPTKEGWRLRYSVLEGPEIGVYHRGKVTGEGIINLPNYWEALIDENSISVQLTPIGNSCVHYVSNVSPLQITIACDCGEVNAYYVVFATRKDVDPLTVEYQV